MEDLNHINEFENLQNIRSQYMKMKNEAKTNNNIEGLK